MEPFVTFRDADKSGQLQYYILQRDFPHYVGLISEKQNLDAIIQMPISGHNLWILFAGTIRGNYMPSYTDAIKEIEHVYSHMAAWYYENRISSNLKKYKRYAIK